MSEPGTCCKCLKGMIDGDGESLLTMLVWTWTAPGYPTVVGAVLRS
jgi:hypothetical protein